METDVKRLAGSYPGFQAHHCWSCSIRTIPPRNERRLRTNTDWNHVLVCHKVN